MISLIVLGLLKADGWFEVGQTGSHKQLKHPTKAGRVTVAALIPVKAKSEPARSIRVNITYPKTC